MGIRDCALENPFFQKLQHFYLNRNDYLTNVRANGGKTVGKLGFGVCDELIRAAGLESVAVFPEEDASRKTADQYLEYAFTEKGKRLFSRIAAGNPAITPDFIAISDSEDVMNRIYYYLRELKREEPERMIPELYLVDWLFSRHMMYQRWNLMALERFCGVLEKWSGTRITEEALRREIALSNRVIAAAQKLTALRAETAPRLTGCEALVMFGAGDLMDRSEYADCLEQLASDAENWPVAEGKKLYFCGSTQYDTDVYAAVEKLGFVVCGEDHDRGIRAFGRPIRTDLAPLAALVNSYMMRSPSAQKGLVHERVSALTEEFAASGASAVMFYSDRYDEAGSWDYPSQKKELDRLGVPSACFCKMDHPFIQDASFLETLGTLSQQIGG